MMIPDTSTDDLYTLITDAIDSNTVLHECFDSVDATSGGNENINGSYMVDITCDSDDTRHQANGDMSVSWSVSITITVRIVGDVKATKRQVFGADRDVRSAMFSAFEHSELAFEYMGSGTVRKVSGNDYMQLVARYRFTGFVPQVSYTRVVNSEI